MRLLAIDTAFEDCSVAVVTDERTVVRSETLGRGHAERLMPMIEAAMLEAGQGFSDLDRIAVTIGPGSFTGVRVGIAAARGLALAVGCAAVGIGTLAALADEAEQVAGPLPVLALIDARRGEVYAQAFKAGLAPIAPPIATTPAEAALSVQPGMVLAGSGADLVAALLPSGITAPVVHRKSSPDILAVARLGAREPAPDRPPAPLYLRPPDAKPQAAAMVARR